MSNNPTNVLIMGAAGRDFHNFNVYFRDNPAYHVAAFTATQIPDIEGRTYPAALAGEQYPNGIPIYLEDELADLIRSHSIDQVVFAYSDVPYHYVMSKGALVNAAGADFIMQGPDSTMLGSSKPVISVCLNYNTPEQVELGRMTVEDARRYLAEGQFPIGSMGPKIQAAVEFVEQGGERGVVCMPEGVIEALEGQGGTVVEK